MGDLADGITEHGQKLSEQFRQAHVYNKKSCRVCWARFFCSGGCHANAELFHHDIMQPYELGCQISQMRLECAIWLAVKEVEQCS